MTYFQMAILFVYILGALIMGRWAYRKCLDHRDEKFDGADAVTTSIMSVLWPLIVLIVIGMLFFEREK